MSVLLSVHTRGGIFGQVLGRGTFPSQLLPQVPPIRPGRVPHFGYPPPLDLAGGTLIGFIPPQVPHICFLARGYPDGGTHLRIPFPSNLAGG